MADRVKGIGRGVGSRGVVRGGIAPLESDYPPGALPTRIRDR